MSGAQRDFLFLFFFCVRRDGEQNIAADSEQRDICDYTAGFGFCE